MLLSASIFTNTEYAYTLRVDEKSDVYSFGVVLLELITGRHPVGGFGDGVDIVRWVCKTISEVATGGTDSAAAVLSVIDRRLASTPLDLITNLFKVAMLCVEESSTARPTMREVVQLLSNPTSSPHGLSLWVVRDSTQCSKGTQYGILLYKVCYMIDADDGNMWTRRRERRYKSNLIAIRRKVCMDNG